MVLFQRIYNLSLLHQGKFVVKTYELETMHRRKALSSPTFKTLELLGQMIY